MCGVARVMMARLNFDCRRGCSVSCIAGIIYDVGVSICDDDVIYVVNSRTLLETVPKKKTKTLFYNISVTAHGRICSRCRKENSRLAFTEMVVLGRCRPFVGSRRCVPIRCCSMNQLRIRHYRIRRTGCRHHRRRYRKSRVLRALRGGVVGSLRR